MSQKFCRRIFQYLSLVAVLGSVSDARGQSSVGDAEGYPVRAIRLVVPFGPGAATDTLGRVIAQKLEAKWKQTVYVENLAGGGGLLGAAAVSRAAPDGYSFVLVTSSHVIAPAIMANPPFEPIKSFAPVTLLAKAPSILLAGHPSGINTLADLVTAGRNKEVSYGSSGLGSKHHITVVEFARLSGTKLQHIPYRGSAQAMNDLMGGHLPVQMGSVSFAHGVVREGKVKALALAGDARHPMLPDVPTFTELGYPLVSAEWWGLLAPPGTPRPILDKVAGEIAQIVQMPDVKARMPADELVSSSPQAFSQFMQDEAALWGRIAKDAGVRLE
jgi:tripartite-type tricarboxylate transporter receptor subunit TctC